ncbi:GNAT family N-acetyltransferase [Salibacter halophilus]|uniref:GNAT family N-acetyltransferase n=1 Tax=Salibacter halophilus TaxID=1803916 RepID=A0A6N6M5Q8_9FLAO|nr:GNAT family N-acetyltransferase [Salibacter halophilus]KAB1063533.1 GNAT family N-acetyltransferase [Salibacter halophilus]
MRAYKCLNQQVIASGEYKLVPIRHEDRYKIMKWRNEQLYHLRQSEPLTKEWQDKYFEETVSKLFEQQEPDQILFSFLKNEECIGYGGLVHINWIDKNAEISFIMGTSLEKEHFKRNWSEYLSLIEKVAFEELNLHKIYTYAFDIRPSLYSIFERNEFKKEAELIEHVSINKNDFHNVIIHSKINKEI